VLLLLQLQDSHSVSCLVQLVSYTIGLLFAAQKCKANFFVAQHVLIIRHIFHLVNDLLHKIVHVCAYGYSAALQLRTSTDIVKWEIEKLVVYLRCAMDTGKKVKTRKGMLLH